MKNLKTLLVLLIFTVFSCDNNDDLQTDPITPTEGFTHNNVFYPTPNAYFEIDDGDVDNNGMPDSYSFFFSNGRMFDNDANVNSSSGDYLFSLNTTNWVYLNVQVSDNPSLDAAGPLPGNTYVVSSITDTVIIENAQIDALSPVYITSNVEFGMGNENVGVFNFPGTQGPSITINAINIDNNNPTESTVNADYVFLNQNGETIVGHYEGTFGVILD
ncbi:MULTISPECIES: hypothetical protein [Bizionia]|uniref:Uncharacterized protein n=1 Tax=Bizionia algoritergicola TaxID=291187 RepID=A0A5D0QTZ5_9FLAO|nr:MULTISPECIES: hypothetical protein [Bizionia]OBX20135.1 hypothetical protein BAA08_14920 [Bizionia sp. APA-3]TYB72375.1 hypothetical protein ES675_11470 [Bizionia algoritergicola]